MMLHNSLPALVVLCLGLGTATAQTTPTGPTSDLRAPLNAEAAKVETVRLLVGLAEIERDLQLGLLGGAGATDAATVTWPAISDGVMAAGGPDLGPLLEDLAQRGSAAFAPVSLALAQARSALDPSAADLVAAIVALGDSVAQGLNPAGPTEAPAYRSAWAGLIVARGQIDLLLRNPDPAVAKAAVAAAGALDELILALPDPALPSPGMLTPAEVQGALQPLARIGAV